MKYRKKPVEVEAMRLDFDTATEIFAWAKKYIRRLLIKTGACVLELELYDCEDDVASKGDYIVKEHGEFIVVYKEIFELSYEKVEE